MRVFTETQRLDHWWVWLINFVLIGFLLFLLYTWFVANEPVDKVLADDYMGQIIVVASIVPVPLLFYVIKLRTSIDEVGIHFQFLPFQFSKKTVRWNEMEKCYVRTYSPIKEYGGWGFRSSMGKKGNAYNLKGNKGIQIEFKTGKKLLIGTQKEAEATQVINRYFNRLS